MNTEGKQYAIFLDIDGTLMGESADALNRNLAVISKVRALGHKVLINTGRATAYLPSRIDAEKYFDGVITGAGARIILDGKEIFCRPVALDAVRRFCEFCLTKENLCFLEGISKMLFIGKDDRGGVWSEITEETIDDYVTADLKVEKFSIMGTADSGLGDAMGKGFTVMQHEYYAEVIQEGITKSSAMKTVLDALGLSDGQSIAMGDSLNDFDMIECAGIGVAMGNAIPAIKDIADMVTESVDDAGVAVALEKIFKL